MSTRDQILQLKQRMGESIIGQEQVIERLLLTLLANGTCKGSFQFQAVECPRIVYTDLDTSLCKISG